MRTATVIPIHSQEFRDLLKLFHSLERPYTLDDIIRFNHTYQKIYWRLAPEEKSRGEEIVDLLIEGVESRELASKIFGVV